MLELNDKTLLNDPPAYMALWLFAQGDERPEVADTVRAVLLRAMQADKQNPLNVCMGIPSSGQAWRIRCRNYLLGKAALTLPSGTSLTKMAENMQCRVPKLALRIEAAWTINGELPSSSSDFERLVCAAMRTETNLEIGFESYKKIIPGQVMKARNHYPVS